MTARKWSQEVTEHSDALDLKQGVFESHDPRRIAESLKESAEHSKRRKASPFRSGNYPPPAFERRFCDLQRAQARVLTMTLKGFAPLRRAVSMVVRTSASASAAHMAR